MIIGITGGVGTGKSTILNVLQSSYRAKIIMADNVGKAIMKPGNDCYDMIVEEFGTEILFDIPEKQLYGASDIPIKVAIDRDKLSAVVFNDAEKLKKLEAIIHPEVKKEIMKTVDEIYEFNPDALIVLEAALLIEGGYKEICDDFWVVTADKETRIERLMNSRKYSREKCESIMDEQMSEEEYISHADFVIDNSKDIETTVSQIKTRLKELNVI